MWQHLIETALLGVEKKPFDREVLPDEIRSSFNQSNEGQEQTFLETVTLSYFYLEAGKLPPKMHIEADDRIIDETLETAPSQIIKIFNLLEKVQARLKEKLYNLWLDILIKKQYIVSSEIVIKLLLIGNSYSETTKSKILKVIGNKGCWILSLHSGLQYNQTLKDEVIWLEGNANDRKILLEKHLKINPDNAISMIQSTWEEEPLVNKRSFLDVLIEFRIPQVIAFAENLYEREFSFQPKEKKTEKECRRILAQILLGSKESQLHKSTIKKLTGYFSIEKKKSLLSFVTSKSQPEYQLPTAEDEEFWNAKTMEQLYGFEVKNYDISLFNNINQFWLSCFFEIIPADAWISGNLDTYAELWSCFIDKDEFRLKVGGKNYPVFLNAIMQNAIAFENNPLSLLLLTKIPTTEAIPLLKYLKPGEFEEFVRKNKYYADAEILQNGPYNLTESWSLSFSEYILTNINELAMQASTINLNEMGIVIAQYIHTDSDNALQKHHNRASSSSYYYQWNTSIYEPVDAVLQIRKLLKTFNS